MAYYFRAIVSSARGPSLYVFNCKVSPASCSSWLTMLTKFFTRLGFLDLELKKKTIPALAYKKSRTKHGLYLFANNIKYTLLMNMKERILSFLIKNINSAITNCLAIQASVYSCSSYYGKRYSPPLPSPTNSKRKNTKSLAWKRFLDKIEVHY